MQQYYQCLLLHPTAPHQGKDQTLISTSAQGDLRSQICLHAIIKGDGGKKTNGNTALQLSGHCRTRGWLLMPATMDVKPLWIFSVRDMV